MTNASASQAQWGVHPKGPTGRVVAQYGNEAGAAFDVTPENTAGLRAGAVVQDAAGRQWMVDDDYRWTPYTGAGQWQAVSAADDARQKLVQDWYNSGKDPANTQAAAMEAFLKDAGRLGAREANGAGPMTRENVGPSGVNDPPSAAGFDPNAAGTPSTAFGGSSPGEEAWGTSFQRYLNDYERQRDRIVDGLAEDRFSYDPAADPVWQSYQKQYRREGQRSSEDALGRASAMTGGVPSSYAVTAAAQAGNNYAAQLADRFPEIYQSAYSRYLQEYERQLSLADAYERYAKRENEWQQALRQYEEKLRER